MYVCNELIIYFCETIDAATFHPDPKKTLREPCATSRRLRRNADRGHVKKVTQQKPCANLARLGIIGVFIHLARTLRAALAKPCANLARTEYAVFTYKPCRKSLHVRASHLHASTSPVREPCAELARSLRDQIVQ